MQNYVRAKNAHFNSTIHTRTFSFHIIIYSCIFIDDTRVNYTFGQKNPLSLLFPPKTKFNLKWNINGIHISSLPLPTDQK